MMEPTTQRDRKINKRQGRWEGKAHKVQSVSDEGGGGREPMRTEDTQFGKEDVGKNDFQD